MSYKDERIHLNLSTREYWIVLELLYEYIKDCMLHNRQGNNFGRLVDSSVLWERLTKTKNEKAKAVQSGVLQEGET